MERETERFSEEQVRRQAGALARSLDEAEDELRRLGSVPPEEVERMLNDVFVQLEASGD